MTGPLVTIKDASILISNMQIIDTREQSSISSTWTESLCLKKIDAENYLLFVGGYEAIGEVSDFYDEEIDDVILPETIDGQRVQGIEDGYIIVGESIIQNEDDGEVIFNDLNDKNLKSWLKSVSWDYEETLSLLRLAIEIN